MNVKVLSGNKANDIEIATLEQAIGVKLPSDYVEFLKVSEGAELDNNCFFYSDGSQSGVNQFIPLSQINTESHYLENLPKHAFPIAWAEGGNYVYLSLTDPVGVFFWDHEEPHKTYKVAPSFKGFLDCLKPANLEIAEYDDVEEAWVDPEFLKSLT